VGEVCADCGQPIDDTGEWEITIRSEHFDVVGVFIGDLDHLKGWAKHQELFGLVTASPMEHSHG